MTRGRSNALIEVGDVFRFNGLRGQPRDFGPDPQYKILEIDVFGQVHIAWSPDGDTQWDRQSKTVTYTETLHLIDENVWEMVE